ncbi:MAG: hypothetical protein E7646_06005 [Ruminococcaceae bacterium]|nr:hypothetical protein [Oscillospiraceae bacterium]
MRTPSGKTVDRFIEAVREKKVASSYIIEGARGVGKLDTARYFSCALCCENGNNGIPCLECVICDSILKGEFADVTELGPEEEGKQIKVESVRELLKKVYLLPSQAQWRIFIIRNSELLNDSGQNALLKSLEEPGAGVVFFLLTDDALSLLGTVRSRSVLLKVPPMESGEMRAMLKAEFGKRSDSDIDLAVRISSGSIGTARRFLSGSKLFDHCKRVLGYLEDVSSGLGLSALSVRLSPASCTRAELGELLPILKQALRDVMLYQAVGEDFSPELFSSFDELSSVAMGISRKKACAMLDRVCELLNRLEGNVNCFAAVSSLNILSSSKV